MATPAYAGDVLLSSSMSFKLFALDLDGNPGELDFTNAVIKYRCGDGTEQVINETGDTLTYQLEGEHTLVTDDQPCSASLETASTMWLEAETASYYSGALAKVVTGFKVVDSVLSSTRLLPELAQAIPSATPTFEEAIMALYMCMFRSEVTTTTSSWKCKDDSGTIIFSRTLGEAGGTFTRGEATTGP